MHPADIKAEISKAGTTQKKLAIKMNVTPATVFKVVHGTTVSRRIAKEISGIIGKPINKIWPGLYKSKAA
ncbi:MAG: hypothetical protein FVQ79_00585 [Planctomycetes bacterium]|nr:hypothetical protein [Planctomycetota bacterium]